MRAIEIIRKNKGLLQKNYGVRGIGIIGLSPEGSIKGPLDIIVELEEGHRNFDNYIKLRTFLEDLLGPGVDLVPYPKAPRFYFRKGLFLTVEYA